VVVFAEDEVVGIVPLVMRNRVIQFLGTPEADYADIICEEERAAEVLAVALRTLCESVTGWSECFWQHLSKHSRVMRHYHGLSRELRGSVHCIATERYQTISLGAKSDTVFKSLLGKRHTRRRQNKLQKAGQVRFRHLETQQEAETYLSDFFRHHVRRHAVIGRQSLCATPEYCQFMRALIKELGPAERVRFGVLELDSRPLAWHFSFQVNGKFLLYQHTFDLDAWDYTPGELLLRNLLEYAKDHITREFDFGRGEELYKDRFANYSRETFSLFIEPTHFAGRIRGLVRAIQGYVQPSLLKMKQIVKSRRATLRAFRSMRMWTVGTSARVRQANKDGVLLQYGLHLIRNLLRGYIWRKRSIEVFAAETLRSWDVEPLVSAHGDRDLEVSEARFGDLVDLASQHPDTLSLSDLPRCRERLKRGERVYVVRQKSCVVILCWVNSTLPTTACCTQSPYVKPSTSAMVVHECWGRRNSDTAASYQLLLSVLGCEAVSKKANLLIHCGSDQPGLRSELERQGFLPRCQITRYNILRRFCHDSVLVYPRNAVPLCNLPEVTH